jgi:hypothetical protein
MRDLMLTLVAFLSYSSSLVIIYLAASEAAVVGGAGAWLPISAFAIPFGWLLARLYTERDKPWSDLSGGILVIYLFCNFCVLVSWTGVFHDLPLKSAIAAQRRNLQEARDSLSLYVRENTAVPADLSPVLPVMPALKLPVTPHKPGSEVRVSTFADIQDSGQWLYVADSSAPVILIDCTHLDHKGKPWSSY